jgi:predicted nuclease of predicted toxin-antitoxin system
MRIKLDENLPSGLSDQLKELGHDADTVAQEGLIGSDDETLWLAAQAAERFFITKTWTFQMPADTQRAVILAF